MTGDSRHAAARDAIEAALVGDGAPFETEFAQVLGQQLRVWKHAPRDLRCLFAQAGSWGDAPALTYEGRTVTWNEYGDTVGGVAAGLVTDFGIKKGDRVAIAMRNYPEWALAFAAAVSVGAIAVPLNSWWSADELEFALGDSGSSLLFADHERATLLRDRRGRLPLLRAVVEAEPEALAGDASWKDAFSGAGASFDVDGVPMDTDDDATILYTSGTTGRPKGAIATHRAHATELMNILYQGEIHGAVNREREVPVRPVRGPSQQLVAGPLFHVSNIPKLYVAAARGQHLIFMRRWEAAAAIDLIDGMGLDSFAGVPTMVRQLLDEAEAVGTTMPSLRLIGTGGAPSPAAQIQRIASQFDRGVAPSTGYGLTETTGAVLGIASADFLERPVSFGRSFPTTEIRLLGPDGAPSETGAVGEAWLRGPTLARAYWNRPAEDFAQDGWFRTGDLLSQDEDGFFRIVDRLKDVVIRGGENVYCAEVERLLGTHPAVLDVAVLGMPHEVLGEEVAAVVQLREEMTASESELREHVARTAAAFKVPSLVVVMDAPLPRNPTGKVLKAKLRSYIESLRRIEEKVGHDT